MNDCKKQAIAKLNLSINHLFYRVWILEYSEIPSLLKELWGMNLKPTIEDSYGKAMLLIEKNELHDEKVMKAIKLIAKQKELKIVDFPSQTALF